MLPASLVRPLGRLTGLPPDSTYDAAGLPLYEAFGTKADLRPFDVLAPATDLKGLNSKVAYGAAASARMNLHMAMKYGKHPHHIAESLFKGFARALKQAVSRDRRVRGVPSTKGTL